MTGYLWPVCCHQRKDYLEGCHCVLGPREKCHFNSLSPSPSLSLEYVHPVNVDDFTEAWILLTIYGVSSNLLIRVKQGQATKSYFISFSHISTSCMLGDKFTLMCEDERAQQSIHWSLLLLLLPHLLLLLPVHLSHSRWRQLNHCARRVINASTAAAIKIGRKETPKINRLC